MIILLFIFSIFNYFTVVVFLRQGIHCVPSSRHGGVVAGTVVVPVEAMGAVKLFADVFVGLGSVITLSAFDIGKTWRLSVVMSPNSIMTIWRRMDWG